MKKPREDTILQIKDIKRARWRNTETAERKKSVKTEKAVAG